MTACRGFVLPMPAPVARRVVVVAGPTAVGKSALGMRLCEALPGELVSVDSVQVRATADAGLHVGAQHSGHTCTRTRQHSKCPSPHTSALAQVYRGLQIGANKPSAVERARTAHHLIDVAELSDDYTAGTFYADTAT